MYSESVRQPYPAQKLAPKTIYPPSQPHAILGMGLFFWRKEMSFVLRLLPLALMATLTWYALSSVAAGPAPQAASCEWPCGGVVTAFSGGGSGLAGLPTPAEALGRRHKFGPRCREEVIRHLAGPAPRRPIFSRR